MTVCTALYSTGLTVCTACYSTSDCIHCCSTVLTVCTALYSTADCTALYSTADCTALYSTVLTVFTALYSTVLTVCTACYSAPKYDNREHNICAFPSVLKVPKRLFYYTAALAEGYLMYFLGCTKAPLKYYKS